MVKFYALLIPILFSSCIASKQLKYLGNSYAPTQKIDVYVDASAIRKSYTIVGKSYVETDMLTNLEKVQQKAIQKAKQKGADAILFQDYILQDGGSFQTVTKTDTAGASVRIRTRATPVETNRLDILFLKYE